MSAGAYIAVFAIACLAGAGLTAVVLRLVTRMQVIDVPNQRSSHAIPTPRGGGLAIDLVLLVAAVLLAWRYSDSQFLWLAGVVGVLSWLGWRDDKQGLPVPVRLVAQLLVGLGVVALFGRITTLDIGSFSLSLSWLAWPFSVLFVVWMINLYNFMDGIDGIAGVEALTAGLVLALWFHWTGADAWSVISLVSAAASAGFLFYNWQPARIFLGDTGSVTLGGVFATISLAGIDQAEFPLSAVVLLFGVFIGDATITLVRRWLRGENLTQAHRSHFYQIAVARGLQHKQVSLAVLGLNMILALLASLVFAGIQPIWLWEVTGLLVVAAAMLAVLRMTGPND